MDINVFNLHFKERVNMELEDLLAKRSEILKIPPKLHFYTQYEDFHSLYFIRKGTTCHYMLDREVLRKSSIHEQGLVLWRHCRNSKH